MKKYAVRIATIGGGLVAVLLAGGAGFGRGGSLKLPGSPLQKRAGVPKTLERDAFSPVAGRFHMHGVHDGGRCGRRRLIARGGARRGRPRRVLRARGLLGGAPRPALR